MWQLAGKLVREAKTMLRIRQALRELEKNMINGHVTPDILERSILAWNNGRWVSSVGFLTRAVEACQQSRAMVVECGSGLSTAVLALALRGSNRDLVSLEHHKNWARRTRMRLFMAGIHNVRILHRPLVSKGDCSWYSVSPIDIPEAIGLVVCDGPPANTPGGRRGMLATLKPHFDTELIIVLDDVNRKPELDAAYGWASELESTAEISDADRDGKQFAVIAASFPLNAVVASNFEPLGSPISRGRRIGRSR